MLWLEKVAPLLELSFIQLRTDGLFLSAVSPLVVNNCGLLRHSMKEEHKMTDALIQVLTRGDELASCLQGHSNLLARLWQCKEQPTPSLSLW